MSEVKAKKNKRFRVASSFGKFRLEVPYAGKAYIFIDDKQIGEVTKGQRRYNLNRVYVDNYWKGTHRKWGISAEFDTRAEAAAFVAQCEIAHVNLTFGWMVIVDDVVLGKITKNGSENFSIEIVGGEDHRFNRYVYKTPKEGAVAIVQYHDNQRRGVSF